MLAYISSSKCIKQSLEFQKAPKGVFCVCVMHIITTIKSFFESISTCVAAAYEAFKTHEGNVHGQLHLKAIFTCWN